MKVYLAGPMKGHPFQNQGSFINATKDLRAMGHEVWSPWENAPGDGFELIEYLRIDLPALLDCDAIALLPGWRTSKGAMVEYTVAKACGLQILSALTGKPLQESILQEAQELVYGPRQESYGSPTEDFERTAGMLRALFGWPVEAKDVPDMMICVKLSRRQQSPGSRDHLVDIAGYAACGEFFLRCP